MLVQHIHRLLLLFIRKTTISKEKNNYSVDDWVYGASIVCCEISCKDLVSVKRGKYSNELTKN
jgi:hypothetical protein